MEKLSVHTDHHTSTILLGESIEYVERYLPDKRVVIITDRNVFRNYERFLTRWPCIVFEPGELHKTLQTIDYITGELVRLEADRGTFILGVGGGIVCDVAGFTASIYMRGLHFGFVSTSLLSQVDASVGGKNGVNFHGYKNMIGVFRQPDFVLCDYRMLKTLDRREFISGFAEVVKAAAIRDAELFSWLESNYSQMLSYQEDALHYMIAKSVKIKILVVEKDEKEKNERRILNFGHTFGHAIEKTTGLPHGEAVSIGMILAARLSERLGYCQTGTTGRLADLLAVIGLPVQSPVAVSDLYAVITSDKKREGDRLHLVLLRQIGEALFRPVQITDLKNYLYDLC